MMVMLPLTWRLFEMCTQMQLVLAMFIKLECDPLVVIALVVPVISTVVSIGFNVYVVVYIAMCV